MRPPPRLIPIVLLLALAPLARAAEFHLSPGGSDATGDGSAQKPFATLEKARDLARAGDRIVLHGGLYRLARPLILGPANSGVAWVAAPGETPVISGGARITGWKRADPAKNLWCAQVPGADFRQLYADGRKAARAEAQTTVTLAWTPEGMRLKTPGVAAPSQTAGLELAVRTRPWTEDWLPVAGYADGLFNISDEAWRTFQAGHWQTKPMSARLVGSREFLSKPGEWSLDPAAGKVYRIPLPGEDPAVAVIEAPKVERLVALAGSVEQPVEKVSFTGITFEMAHWAKPNRGLFSNQANQMPGLFGALDAVGARNLKVDSCTFRHLGGIGLFIGPGSRDCQATHCTFTDIAAGAIQIGTVDAAQGNGPEAVAGTTVADCAIRGVATDYRASCAVFVGYAADTLIEHNEISEVPYTGISLGWGWTGPQVAAARGNRIVGNHIHDHMRSLEDGGGIYVNGRQKNGLITGNFIHGQQHEYAQLYLDDGATDWRAVGNVCRDGGPRAAWCLYKGEGNTVTGNFSDTNFIYKRNTGPCTVKDNTVVAPGAPWPAGAEDIMKNAGVRPKTAMAGANPAFGHPNGPGIPRGLASQGALPLRRRPPFTLCKRRPSPWPSLFQDRRAPPWLDRTEKSCRSRAG